ncbi:hypothetical protein OC845_002449 [Tilletia horrida]|nr:hypothetical protein OC845_002449 [Tilletia horrida]
MNISFTSASILAVLLLGLSVIATESAATKRTLDECLVGCEEQGYLNCAECCGTDGTNGKRPCN